MTTPENKSRKPLPAAKDIVQMAAWSRWPSWSRTAVLAAGIGLVSGMLSALLYLGLRVTSRVLFQIPLHVPEDLSGNFQWTLWGAGLLVLIPALGGLAVGLLGWRVTQNILGGGTELILDSYHNKDARLDGHLVPLKWLASCLTVGSGGSGGTEGPISLIGSAAGSWLAQRLGLSLAERRLLFTAGLAGGIASVFRAPLGGALFACEVYYTSPEVEQEALVPALLASVSAYLLFGFFVGFEPLLPGDKRMVLGAASMVWFTLIALAATLAAHLFGRIMRLSGEYFGRVALPWRPAVGGVVNGLLALTLLGWAHWCLDGSPLVLAVLAEGYPMLERLVLGGVAPTLILTVAVAKMFSSGVTLASGGSSGIFAPIMVVGGCVGALVAAAAAPLGLVGIAAKPAVLAGMAALFAAGTACPLSALFITTEVAQGYHLLPGLMWAVALAYLLRPRPGLIAGQVANSADSPAHRGRLRSAVLRRVRIGAAMQPLSQICVFKVEAALAELRPAVEGTRQELYPVVDGEGRYRGAFHWRSVLFAPPGSTAGVLAAQFPPLPVDGDLEEALEALTAQKAEELPVVDEKGRLRGLLKRRDLFSTVAK
jgi:CIC family chloride channel protein